MASGPPFGFRNPALAATPVAAMAFLV